MSEQWRRVNELFHEALERPDAERASLVTARAAGDEALRDEVMSLLAAHERAGGFLQGHAVSEDAGGHPSTPPGAAGAPLLQEGHSVGAYRIERELGRGGMGVVYLAEDTRLGRRVALKALAPAFTHDPQRRERLRKEAQAAASLSHANIATVFALEDIGGDLFIASEYVPGETLRAEIERGAMPVDRVLQVGVQVARALAAAHDRRIVHRDLKPENVICSAQGAAKILDFGIARSAAGGPGGRLTEPGTIIGTPGYMSPEQIEAQEVDFRSDLFSFGVLLYELATGVHPFEGRTAASTVGRILAHEPCPPSQLRALPAEFDRIVRKCLQKRPDDRFQSTSDLALDLEQLLAVSAFAHGASADKSTSAQHASAERHASAVRGPADKDGDGARPSLAVRWWRVHQLATVALYALMTGLAWLPSRWIDRDWATAAFFGCVAAAALNGTLRVHLLFTERHNRPAFRGELRRAAAWMRGSDVAFGLGLLALAVSIPGGHTPIAILLAAVSAGAIIASIAVEPATTDAAFPRRTSGVRRRPGGTGPRGPEVK